jgi:hypothetical protein
MADTRLLVGLCLSLLISSMAISLVTGVGAASLGDVGEAVNLDIDFETDSHGWKNDIFTIGSDWRVVDGALTSQGSGSNLTECIPSLTTLTAAAGPMQSSSGIPVTLVTLSNCE